MRFRVSCSFQATFLKFTNIYFYYIVFQSQSSNTKCVSFFLIGKGVLTFICLTLLLVTVESLIAQTIFHWSPWNIYKINWNFFIHCWKRFFSWIFHVIFRFVLTSQHFSPALFLTFFPTSNWTSSNRALMFGSEKLS